MNIFNNSECICCGNKSSIFQVCPECQKNFLSINFDFPRCNNCGKTLISEDELCSECKENPVLVSCDSVFPIFSYMIWKKDLLFFWKMEGKRFFAFFFAKKIYEVYKRKYDSLPIVPVPPRPKKIWNTGWDQINDVKNILHIFYKIPVINLLQRTEKGQQKKRSRQERINHRGADYLFHPKKISSNKGGKATILEEVVLIDDILTTGVTLETCARILKENGVKKVHAITVFIAE